jgi:hypothetical protein
MRIASVIVLSAVMASASVTLAETARVTPSSGTRFSIEGTTNVGPWNCRGSHVDVTAVVAAGADEIEAIVVALDRTKKGPINATGAISTMPRFDLKLTIPVRTLECGNARMERDMYNALRASQYKSILFDFGRVISAELLKSGSYRVVVEGDLTLAGVEKPRRLTLFIDHTAPKRFTLRGELPLKMTEFNVKPPVALLGMIKAHDALTVKFHLPVTIH